MSVGRAAPRRRGIAVNTIAQAAPQLVGYLASFASAPIVLASLGLRDFGIWALTGALAQYASLLDFGVGPVLVRFIALHHARGEDDQIPEVLGTGLVTSALMLVALTIATFVAAAPLGHAVKTSTSEMRVLLGCATVMFVTSLVTNVLTSFAIGMQEMIGLNVANTLGAVFNFVLSVAAAVSAHNLSRYAMANAFASICAMAVVMVVSRDSMRGRTHIALPSFSRFKEILSFSVKTQALTASNLVNLETDKIIIALAIGPAAAGAYELANRIASAARSIGILAIGAMTPTMTAAVVEESAYDVAQTYLRWTTRSSALGLPFVFLVAAMPSVILHAWLGTSPPDSAVVLSALSLTCVVPVTTGVGYILAQARGRPGLPAQAAVWTAVANLVLTLSLVPFFGIWGVLVGTAVALSCGALYQVWLTHRAFDIPFGAYVSAVAPSIAVCAAAAVPVLVIDLIFQSDGRIVQAVALVGGGLVFLVLYTYGALRQGLLPEALARRIPGRAARL